MNFGSDNVAGTAPEILEAIIAANRGSAPSYGEDEISDRLDGLFSDLFEREVAVVPVATGTAANALALSILTPVYGAIYCHEESHVYLEECGAPELFSGGAKLVPLPGDAARIELEALERGIAMVPPGFVHMMPPAAVSLTQATESGTLYGLDRVGAVSALCRRHAIGLHMDGARFANAVVSLGCSPAEASWKAGVDVLSFGATKNGAMAAEAVVLFDPARKEELLYRRKRTGHLWSKMRFIAAQLQAYLADDLWLRNAAHANRMAASLGDGLAAIDGITLAHPVEANEVFALMPEELIAALEAEGVGLHRWPTSVAPMARLVAAFDTTEEDVLGAIDAARRHAGTAG
jgi:threonine aldolase